jgi:septum site-determining protein MinC
LHTRLAQLSKIEVITQTEALYTLRVLSNNTDALVDEINLLARSSKAQFQHAPVILEIESRNFQANELAVLIEILSQNEMVAVGIRSQKQELIDFAKFSGLAVFGKSLSPSKKIKLKFRKLSSLKLKCQTHIKIKFIRRQKLSLTKCIHSNK